jgi:hypothetical protein
VQKIPFVVASAIVGFALLAGSTQAVTVAEAQVPLETTKCYYHLWTCHYVGNDYWSGCDEHYGEAWISTYTARSVCARYNDGDQ